MKSLKASEFKAKCLKLMDEVAETGEEIVITKNGIAMTKLVPYRVKPSTLFGGHKGKITSSGDIVSPIDVQWDAAG